MTKDRTEFILTLSTTLKHPPTIAGFKVCVENEGSSRKEVRDLNNRQCNSAIELLKGVYSVTDLRVGAPDVSELRDDDFKKTGTIQASNTIRVEVNGLDDLQELIAMMNNLNPELVQTQEVYVALDVETRRSLALQLRESLYLAARDRVEAYCQLDNLQLVGLVSVTDTFEGDRYRGNFRTGVSGASKDSSANDPFEIGKLGDEIEVEGNATFTFEAERV